MTTISIVDIFDVLNTVSISTLIIKGYFKTILKGHIMFGRYYAPQKTEQEKRGMMSRVDYNIKLEKERVEKERMMLLGTTEEQAEIEEIVVVEEELTEEEIKLELINELMRLESTYSRMGQNMSTNKIERLKELKKTVKL